MYITDSRGHRIQVFTAEGKFLGKVGKKGSGVGELTWPSGVSIGSDDIVYVTEHDNYRVSMFTSEGQFLRSFGTVGQEPRQFKDPIGIAVDRDGLVMYVTESKIAYKSFKMMSSVDSIVYDMKFFFLQLRDVQSGNY